MALALAAGHYGEVAIGTLARPMRVAYCIGSFASSGGTELNAVRTLESLDRTIVVPTVICLESEGPMRARYDAAGVRTVAFPIDPLWHPGTYWQVFRMARFFMRERFDLVHANDVYTDWVCTLAARIAGLPVLVSKRWTDLHRRFAPLTRLAFHLADGIVGNSTAVLKSAATVERADRAKMYLVPNFLEDEAFDAPSRDEIMAWRERVGLSPGAIVIGTAQRLRAEKGTEVLIEAFARLDRGRGIQLAIVGDGPEEHALRAQVADLPPRIRQQVVFVGPLPSRPVPHHLFDISVLPSRSEGFPNALLEAMAAGRAVISTDVGGVRDAIIDGVTGRLVPPGDSAALAAAVGTLLDAEATRSELGRAAAAQVRRDYGAEASLGCLVRAYRAISSSRQAS
jgi:glycosyltransferase involved in cell wall biosynthesis